MTYTVSSGTLNPTQLNSPHLDDVTLGGLVDTLSSDVAEIVRAGAAIGLSLNIAKCRPIAHPDLLVNATDTLLQLFQRA